MTDMSQAVTVDERWAILVEEVQSPTYLYFYSSVTPGNVKAPIPCMLDLVQLQVPLSLTDLPVALGSLRAAGCEPVRGHCE